MQWMLKLELSDDVNSLPHSDRVERVARIHEILLRLTSSDGFSMMTTVPVSVGNFCIPRLREIDGYLFGRALSGPGMAS